MEREKTRINILEDYHYLLNKKFFRRRVIFLLLIILSGIIVTIVTLNNSQRDYVNRVIEDALTYHRSVAKNYAESLEIYINDHIYLLDYLSDLPAFKRDLKNDEISLENTKYIRNLLNHHQNEVGHVSVYRPDGDLLYSFGENDHYEKEIIYSSVKNSFKEAVKTNTQITSPVYFDEEENLEFSILHPISDDGNVIGIIVLSMKVYHLEQSYLERLNVNEHGYIRIIDQDGTVISHPNRLQIGENFVDFRKSLNPMIDWSDLEKIFDRMINKESGAEIYYSIKWNGSYEREKKISGFHPIEIGNRYWSLGYVSDYDFYASEISSRSLKAIFLACFLILMLLTLTFFILRSIKIKSDEMIQQKYISELSIRDKELSESEKKYRTFVDYLPSGILVLINNRVVYANPTAKKILNPNNTDILENKLILELLSPDDYKKVNHIYENEISLDNSIELRMRTTDVIDIIAECYFSTIDFNGEDAELMIFSDITVKRMAEKALIESEEKLRHTFDNSPAGVSILSLDGDFIKVNKAFCEMLGYSEEEIIRMNMKDITPSENQIDPKDVLAKISNSDSRVFDVIKNFIRKDGSTIIVLNRVSLVLDSNENPDFIINITEDITESEAAKSRIEHLNRVLLTIRKINVIITNAESKQSLIQDICNILIESRSYQDAWITLFDTDGNPENYTSIGMGSQDSVLSRYIFDGRLTPCMKKALNTKGIHLIRNQEKECLNCPIQSSYYLSASMVSRLEYDKEILGFMSVTTSSELVEDTLEQELFEEIVNDISYSINNFRLQYELELGQKKIQSILKSAPIGIGFVINRHIQWVNKQFEIITGYEPNEIIGKNALLMYPSQEEYDYVGREKYRQIRENKSSTGTVLTRWKRKDGDIRNILLSSAALDPNDISKGATFTALDVTEMKKIENDLMESEENYRTLINSAIQNILIIDRDGVFRLVNNSTCKLLGSTEKEIIGKSIFDFINKESAESYMNGIIQCISTLKPVVSVEKISIEDNLYFMERYLQPLSNSSNIVDRVLCISIDVTESKQSENERIKLEEQLNQAKKIESLGQLAGGIAHDFNNLLTPIIGYTQIMKLDLDENDEKYEQFEQIEKAATRAKELTWQLLALGRKQVLKIKPVLINNIISEFNNILRRTIRENITFKYKLDNDLKFINADRSQIEQILMNLVVNAQDAMPDGGEITISTSNVYLEQGAIATSEEFKEGDYIELSTADTGEGMPKDVVDRIFEPFYTTKEKGKGTGLGLATVYGIIRQHNGFIDVESENGKGTKFKVYFPVTENKPRTKDKKKLPRKNFTSNSITIAVAEDNMMVRHMTCQMLHKMGFKTVCEDSAVRLIKTINDLNQKVDLLLSDVVMPDMNGKDLFKILRENLPNLKVLFVSGYGDTVIARHGVFDSELNFIQKPFTYDELYEKVNAIIHIK